MGSQTNKEFEYSNY